MSILLLGASGKLGRHIFSFLTSIGKNVYADTDFSLPDLITEDFFDRYSIDAVINCVGSYSKDSACFHSNFYFPLAIVSFLNSYCSQRLSTTITYVHYSSVSSFLPYITHRLQPLTLSPFDRSDVLGTPYEMSKLYFDTFLRSSVLQNTNLKIHLFCLSVIPFAGKLPPSLHFFLLLLPFRFPASRRLAVSTLESIEERLFHVLSSTCDTLNDSFYCSTIIDRVLVSKFYTPALLFSFKPVLPSFCFRIIPTSGSNGFLSRIFRSLFFLSRL